MFTEFLFHLRAYDLKVSLTEWLALVRAIALGHSRTNLSAFYHLARALLVKNETLYDTYDRAFADYFEGIDRSIDITDELREWLANPILPRELTLEDLAAITNYDLEELRRLFEERMKEQKERHDGGNKWIGTGGTSPFGHSGKHPAGIRVGGGGGGRSAVQVASERRFRNLRNDRVLDTRQMGVALRRLRRLGKDDGPEELDLDATIDKTARDAGEIDLVFGPPKKNRIKLLLLIDVGGSMDPHADLCERLFSAAHAANHFKTFEFRFFHNCVYQRLYTDMYRLRGELTADALKRIDRTWTLVLVGDAWMSPFELTHAGGAIDYFQGGRDSGATSGLVWLKRLRERCPNSVWLNPEPKVNWPAPSIQLIRSVFPMYELTLAGLATAIDVLAGRRPNQALDAKLAVRM